MKAVWTIILIVGVVGFCWADPPQVEWTMTLAGTEGISATSVAQMADGGYVLAGNTDWSSASDNHAWLVRVNAGGDTLWQRQYGGTHDYIWQVIVTRDEQIATCGVSGWSFGSGGCRFWLQKADTSGNLLWSRTFSRGTADYAHAMCQTGDGEFLMAGETTSPPQEISAILMKTNESGDSLWSRMRPETQYSVYLTISQAEGGSLISFGPIADFFGATKFNVQGDTLWTRTLDFNRCYAYHALISSDGGYIAAGTKYPDTGEQTRIVLTKISVSGDSLWTRTFGDGNENFAAALINASDNGYFILKETGMGHLAALYRTDVNGDSLWKMGIGDTNTWVMSAIRTSDGGMLIVGGYFVTYYISSGIWLAKLSPELQTPSLKPQLPQTFSLRAFPNPFNPQTTIEFSLTRREQVTIDVYDVTGRKSATLLDEMLAVGDHRVVFDGAPLATGIYFIHARAGTTNMTKKVVLLK